MSDMNHIDRSKLTFAHILIRKDFSYVFVLGPARAHACVTQFFSMNSFGVFNLVYAKGDDKTVNKTKIPVAQPKKYTWAIIINIPIPNGMGKIA